MHYARPGRRHRYVWSMTAPRGWFLFDGLVRFDLETGAEQRWQFPDGVYASESPMAPRPGATAEDDGWLVTFTTDAARDRSECQVFDAARISEGPGRADRAAGADLERHSRVLGAVVRDCPTRAARVVRTRSHVCLCVTHTIPRSHNVAGRADRVRDLTNVRLAGSMSRACAGSTT
jgi:hypothetical protein